MNEKINHTSGELKYIPKSKTEYPFITDENGDVLVVIVKDSPFDDKGKLFSMAKTAPHLCDNPKCPGNINRQIVEIFPELVHDLSEAHRLIHTMTTCLRMSDGSPDAELLRHDKKWDSTLTRARALQEALK